MRWHFSSLTSHLAELFPASHFPGAFRELLNLSTRLAGSASPDEGQRLAPCRRFASRALLEACVAWRERYAPAGVSAALSVPAEPLQKCLPQRSARLLDAQRSASQDQSESLIDPPDV